ncbi:MAG: glycosyltransferase family 4 protein [Ardenticatenaceae bacterium]|nr:glycosyltransferase family 4 protein [Anaerolineales bacterium]MCB8923237.1 glycosyltransferase family 4 protein [Ardenticatenaceae bacterium]
MRMAMIGPFGLHPNKTMESRALGLARALVARGHAVQIFMPPWQTPAEADRRWQVDGVLLRYVPLRGGVPGIVARLLHEVLAWQPDVVHSFKPKAYSGLAAWWLWQFYRERLWLVTDCDDWEGWGGWNNLAPYSPGQKLLFAWQERWGMTHAHALTVASRELQRLAWSRGMAREQVVYLPNGAGIEEQQAKSERQKTKKPTLLLYSRLFEFDVGRLVRVLAGVKTAVPNLAILSVGTGLYANDAAQLQAQFAAAGLLDTVTDVGWVKVSKLPALLSTADVGIYLMEENMLNRTKCPVKLADMIATGLPIVAEAVGQVPEYVMQGHNGLLRRSGDEAGLIADLVYLLQNRGERERMGGNGRAHYAAHFSWDKAAEHVEEYYESSITS